MKRIIVSVFIGLIVVMGEWPVRGIQSSAIPVPERSQQYRGLRFHPQRILVKYRGESRVRRVWLRRGERVPDKIRALAGDPRVEFAEPDLILTVARAPDDGRVDELWGMETIRAFDAWEVTTGSEDVVIAVIDTGVDYTHPDLADNMWRNLGEIPNNGEDDDGNGFVDDYYGWNAEADNGDPMDDNDHGTHVAGTIGAVGNNGLGVVGVNWRVRIMALKFLGADGSGFLSDAIEAIDYAILMKERGVNIVAINASWGSTGFSFSLRQAIDRATSAGILFVAAAGNDGVSTRFYPAAYQSALAVAALDRDGEHLADFSNFGDWVEVAAPGRSILSTIPGNRYARFSGTSMATPHVTGLAGLVASVAHLSVTELRQVIRQGVRVVPTLDGLVTTSGIVDAAETLNLVGAEPPPDGEPPVANDDSVTTSEDTPVTIDVTANDVDGDGTIDPTTLAIVSQPEHGRAVIQSDGTIRYTPATDFDGTDRFQYTVQDDDGMTSNVAVVTVTVTAINDPPTARDDEAATAENASVLIDVTANDDDVDGDIDPTTVTLVSPPEHGNVDVRSDGKVMYVPATNFTGTDRFRYAVRDDEGALSNEATVTVTVTESDDPPPGENHPPTVTISTSARVVAAGFEVMLVAHVADPDGDAVRYQWFTTAGQLRDQGNRAFLDTAEIRSLSSQPMKVGLGVRVDDGRGGRAEALTAITVIPAGPPAKFSVKVDPPSASMRRGRRRFRIQITRQTDYRAGGVKLEPMIMNGANEIYAVISMSRRKKSSDEAVMYVTLRTSRPSASEYRLRVRGLDDVGGEAFSNIITITVPGP
ncbi:MAG: tandem-95 repeat protein [Acidobacteria bacterium]|nr:MAG: tandem-95 repeat protein [Acidobacteriota bacterium]